MSSSRVVISPSTTLYPWFSTSCCMEPWSHHQCPCLIWAPYILQQWPLVTTWSQILSFFRICLIVPINRAFCITSTIPLHTETLDIPFQNLVCWDSWPLHTCLFCILPDLALVPQPMHKSCLTFPPFSTEELKTWASILSIIPNTTRLTYVITKLLIQTYLPLHSHLGTGSTPCILA